MTTVYCSIAEVLQTRLRLARCKSRVYVYCCVSSCLLTEYHENAADNSHVNGPRIRFFSITTSKLAVAVILKGWTIFSLHRDLKHTLIFKITLDKFLSLQFDNKTCQQSIVLQLRFYRQDRDLLDVKVVFMYILKSAY